MLKKPKNLLIIGCVGMLVSFAFMASVITRQLELVTGPGTPKFTEENLGPILFSGLLAGVFGMCSTIALIAAAVIYVSEKKTQEHPPGSSEGLTVEQGSVR